MENIFLYDNGPKLKTKRVIKGEFHYKLSTVLEDIACGPVIGPVKQKSICLEGVKDDATGLPVEVKKFESFEKASVLFNKAPILNPFKVGVKNNCNNKIIKKTPVSSNFLANFDLNDSKQAIFCEPQSDNFVVRIYDVSRKKLDGYKVLTISNSRNIGKFSNVHNIDTQYSNSAHNGVSLIQTYDSLHYLTIDNVSFNANAVLVPNTSLSCLNSTIVEYFASTSTEGNVFVYDVNHRKHNWGVKFDGFLPGIDNWIGCEFGNDHPMLLNAGTNRVISQFDTRVGKCLISNVLNKQIYETSNISSFKSVPNLPYLYVLDSTNILLFDKRYCKSPVISWNHTGNTLKYPYCFKYCDKNFLLAFDPNTYQSCLISSIWEKSEYPHIESNSAFKCFFLRKNTFKYARRKNLFFNNKIGLRFQSPIVGFVPVHFENDQSMYFLIQNEIGDVFSVEFKSNSENSCSKDKYFYDSLNWFENKLNKVEHLDLNRKIIPITKFTKREFDSVECSEIFSRTLGFKLVESIDPDENKVQNNSDCLSNIDFKELRKFDDNLSKKLLSVWDVQSPPISQTEDIPNKYFYKRYPFFFKTKDPNDVLNNSNKVENLSAIETLNKENKNLMLPTIDKVNANELGNESLMPYIADNCTEIKNKVSHAGNSSLSDILNKTSHTSPSLTPKDRKKRRISKVAGF